MQSTLLNALILGLLATPVVSSPTPPTTTNNRIEKRSFKIPRVRNEAFTGRNGPKALYKALRKHHMSIPPGLAAAMSGDKPVVNTNAKHMSIPAGLAAALKDDTPVVDTNSRHRGGRGRNGANGNDGDVQAAAENLPCPFANGGSGNANNAPDSTKEEDSTSTVEAVVTATVVIDPVNETPTTTIISSPSEDSSVPGGADTNDRAEAGVGEVTATPEGNDVEFISPINIGGQVINVDFDSGSSDLWVFSTRLPANEQRGHEVFDEDQSKTFQIVEGAEFQIRYGDGSFAQGVVGTDVVEIGGVTVQRQAVELATLVSKSFIDDTANNGLLGLAFSTLNTVQPDQQQTFFDNILPDLAQPVFTADLRPGDVGEYEFGRIDPAKFSGEMTFVPVNSSNGFWQFTSDSFAVGNGKQKTSSRGAQAIADTGTTLMLADPNMVDGYYAEVDGAGFSNDVGGVIFPCDTQLPDLTVDIEGVYQATVLGEHINFASVGGGMCFGGLQASEGFQIYGDIFFKSQFVAFDGGNQTLGFANHVF